ncbi:MAG TPA: helix-hairpin-helix domain-containing protein [Candidatus Limnocylindria bacterium]|nr:helix-hairpin-helix domain-containing protein [Candidatus Limnocylindria bacterium]
MDVSLYSRHQLVLLLALIGAAGAGLGIDHWRRAHPDVAEGLELLDRAPAPRPTTAASPAYPAALIDLNRAPADELERLPGVGRAIAARIVGARPFASVDDLARVRGLRGARLARVRTLVTVAQ